MSTVSVINTCYISAETAVGFIVWPCKSQLSMLTHGLDCMPLIYFKFTLLIHSKALTKKGCRTGSLCITVLPEPHFLKLKETLILVTGNLNKSIHVK